MRVENGECMHNSVIFYPLVLEAGFPVVEWSVQGKIYNGVSRTYRLRSQTVNKPFRYAGATLAACLLPFVNHSVAQPVVAHWPDFNPLWLNPVPPHVLRSRNRLLIHEAVISSTQASSVGQE